jgi:hypothetical protein
MWKKYNPQVSHCPTAAQGGEHTFFVCVITAHQDTHKLILQLTMFDFNYDRPYHV